MAVAPRPLRLTSDTTWDDARDRLSRWLEEVRTALAGRLTVRENMAADLKEIEWVGGETNRGVSSAVKSPVYGAVMLWVREDKGAAVSTAFMDWEPADVSGTNGILIRSISGLTSGSRYRIRLLLLGG